MLSFMYGFGKRKCSRVSECFFCVDIGITCYCDQEGRRSAVDENFVIIWCEMF